MKEQALEKEEMPTMIIEEIKRVISTGYAFPVTSNTSRTREKLELRPVKLYDGLSVLAKKTGLLALLEAYKEE
jgi:hypothetical protein